MPRQQAAVKIKCDTNGNHLRFGCNHGDRDMLFKVYLAVVQRRHLESAVAEQREELEE